MSDEMDFSNLNLAALAEMQTDGIDAIQTLLFPVGIYAVKNQSVLLGMSEPEPGALDKDGNPQLPLFFVDFKHEVIEAKPADPKVDADKLVGRILSERHMLWPKQMQDMIALLKGKYKKAGFNYQEPSHMGGLEGGTPGWLDNAVEQLFMIRVKHLKPNPTTGAQRAVYDWNKLATNTGEEDIGG